MTRDRRRRDDVAIETRSGSILYFYNYISLGQRDRPTEIVGERVHRIEVPARAAEILERPTPRTVGGQVQVHGVEALELQAMGDAERGDAESFYVRVEQTFFVWIDRARGLVQDGKRGSMEVQPGQTDALLFAAAQDVGPIVLDSAQTAFARIHDFHQVCELQTLQHFVVAFVIAGQRVHHLVSKLSLIHI